MQSILKTLGRLLYRLCLFAMAAWATLAIFYSSLPVPAGSVAATLFALGSLIALVRCFHSPRARRLFLVAFGLVLIGWLLMAPANDRNWQPDVAVLPWAEINGDQVTIYNIRNNSYRSDADYRVRHYDKSFALSSLQGVDLAVVYWGSPLIAHTMLSFVFADGAIVCFSIETRKEVGEEYSAVKGFFRQYELIYVVADERDLIGVRTNYRGEQVYLYHLNTSPDLARKVFLDYLQQVNSLKNRPEWYNALVSNCTTNIRGHAAPYNPEARFDWRILVNGFLDEMLYERGTIANGLSFPELKRRSLINERAQGWDKKDDFSQRIRTGLPGKEGKS